MSSHAAFRGLCWYQILVGSMGGVTAAVRFDAAAFLGGGATTPIEMTYFSAVSTLISSSMTSAPRQHQEETRRSGFGVVGT
jgi:hypothetical protein